MIEHMEDQGWTKDLPWLGQYVLDENGNAVPAKSLLSWGLWMEEHRADCQLALNRIAGTLVSTIFMGLDMHSILIRNQPHAPILWETIIFGGPYNHLERRYASKEDALEGHAKIVQMLTS